MKLNLRCGTRCHPKKVFGPKKEKSERVKKGKRRRCDLVGSDEACVPQSSKRTKITATPSPPANDDIVSGSVQNPIIIDADGR